MELIERADDRPEQISIARCRELLGDEAESMGTPHERATAQTDQRVGLDQSSRPLTSQAIGVLLRTQLYAGIVDVTDYGIHGKRGDFEPLISEDLFCRVLSVLSGRLPSTTPKQRAHRISRCAVLRCEPVDAGSLAAGRKSRDAAS